MDGTKALKGRLAAFVLSVVLLAAAGCGEREEAPPSDMPMDMPMEMEMDSAMMARHADEAEEMAGRVRTHVEAFRGLSPEQQYEEMAEHTGIVARMLGLMERQMREMSMGMPMDDEAMGRMMGMSGEEHGRMMAELAALRAEVEELQTASVQEIRTRMSSHVDRLAAMVRMLEEMAQAMREM